MLSHCSSIYYLFPVFCVFFFSFVKLISKNLHKWKIITFEQLCLKIFDDRKNVSRYRVTLLRQWQSVGLNLCMYLGYNWRLCALHSQSFPVKTLIPSANQHNINSKQKKINAALRVNLNVTGDISWVETSHHTISWRVIRRSLMLSARCVSTLCNRLYPRYHMSRDCHNKGRVHAISSIHHSGIVAFVDSCSRVKCGGKSYYMTP